MYKGYIIKFVLSLLSSITRLKEKKKKKKPMHLHIPLISISFFFFSFFNNKKIVKTLKFKAPIFSTGLHSPIYASN